ncbi:class I SAM-dependent methyltransferase [uncultured Psychrobacillus sp.]|uniref:class I SAM-dependent methyltransferase n=1 Tax=uncultured Psychrobacillus sp. TaxID=1551585 RepID=UPI00262A497B|nr:class I SAM-dependent methyltransferase [uncultured Psychrobacillus sp.]
MALLNPTLFAEWIEPHSFEWYNQLGKQQGKYTYSWNSTILKANGEILFDEEVRKMIASKKVLDVGCGHGEFAVECSPIAKEIVGFDVTNLFIEQGKRNKPDNVSFVQGSTKEELPFSEDEFDCAYIRKGPTSGYLALTQTVKKGGAVLGLHPGDDMDKELPILFPNLFQAKLPRDSTLKAIQERLKTANFEKWEIETVSNIEILHSPMDIINKRCFGQHPIVTEKIINENLKEITEIFGFHETNGLPITNSYYIVRATV